MALLQNLELVFDADAVMRGQGADPALMRKRSPKLVQVAERAIQEGRPLLTPQVFFREIPVETLQHEKLIFSGGGYLGGRLIVQHLAKAEKVCILLCTIGEKLEARVSEIMASDMVYALALDGVGSAAVEALANAACKNIEDESRSRGNCISIPLSPGMVGWPVEQGQPQIFSLLCEKQDGVRLTSSYVMLPRKSISMVLGIGPSMETTGRQCDFCNLQKTCRYRDKYA
jgi:hypothetical protein